MDEMEYLDIVRHAIGDVVVPFIPTVDMAVYFRTNVLINSYELKAFAVQDAPRVLIGGQPSAFYTLVMIDLDAPNPNDQHLSQLVSWNVPGGAWCEEGMEVASYVGPNPQIGIHRYILVLYRQEERLEDMDEPTSRFCFNIEGFANRHHLGKPVAFAYFNVRRQSIRRNARA